MNTTMRLTLLTLLASGLSGRSALGEDERARLVAQLGHSRPVSSVSFSADGRFVLTGSSDTTARLWDAATGKEIRRFEGHSASVWSVSFSADGRFVLTGSSDTTARLWDAATGKEIRRFEGHSASVWSVSFSADGRFVLTGSRDETARLWDAATGKEIRRFEGHTGEIDSASFSADGRFVLTGSRDKTARLWDAATGKEIRRFEGHADSIGSVSFSTDGRFVLTGSRDKTARLWDATTGKEIRRFEGHSRPVSSVSFSADGRFVLTGSEDKTARLWDATTGKEIRRFEGHSDWIRSASFSADGRFVLTGSRDTTARLWDAATGKEIRRFKGHSHPVPSVSFSADGRFVLTGGSDETARLWDAATGKEIRRFEGHSASVWSVSFSADGRFVLTGSLDKTARLWDAATGKEIRRFAGHSMIASVSFSADGRFVLTGGSDKTARLWDAATGKEIRRFDGHSHWIRSVSFSADGRVVLTGGPDETARLWDAATGKEIRRFEEHSASVWSVSFSADGRFVLTGSLDNTARLWDAATGKEIRRFEGHSSGVSSASFSADGRFVLTGSLDNTARLWDAATGKEIRRFEGHSSGVSSASFSADGRFVLTGGYDSTTRLWDTASGRELCRLISFMNGDWAVVDREGRYDASNAGDVEGLHWVIGNETISLKQLKTRYYEPGLLAKVLGRNKEPLREVKAFTAPKLFPAVRVELKEDTLVVHLKNRGGGIGRVVVNVNGKEWTADARARDADSNAEEMTIEVDLADDRRVKPNEDNVITVHAYEAEDYLRSRGVGRIYRRRAQGDGGTAAQHKPALWAIVAGVSDYHGDRIDLRFAAKDAEDFGAGLRAASERLFGKERVHLTVLADATRDSILSALKAAETSRPSDILVLYLAGHGVNFGGQDGDFYYLTADAASADLKDPGVRERVALSSLELTEQINKIPALKQVMILDTCASGRLIEKLTEKRDVPGSQIRALERMKDRTGLYVLSGCAADSVSYETSRFGQGLLTYSLLLGMKGAALQRDELVDVSTLFQFARDRVEQLAKDIGGVQQPVLRAPKSGSFALGRLTNEDKAKVPLRTERPLYLRSNFQDDEEMDDILELAKRVDAVLDDVSARGRDAPLVFVDARGFPGAYRLAGRYTIKGDEVVAKMRLVKGKQKGAPFSVTGTKSDLEALAKRIVAEAQRHLK